MPYKRKWVYKTPRKMEAFGTGEFEIDGNKYTETVPGKLEGPALTTTNAYVGGYSHNPFIGNIKDVKFYHGKEIRPINKYYEIFSTTVEDFITGWLKNGKVSGRPSAPLFRNDGSLLLSDDKANVIYLVTYKG